LEAIFLVGFGWFFFGISGGHFDFFGWLVKSLFLIGADSLHF